MLYSNFKDGILSKQEYIVEANACATKADELRIFAHELEKEARKYSPNIKGATGGHTLSRNMALVQN